MIYDILYKKKLLIRNLAYFSLEIILRLKVKIE